MLRLPALAAALLISLPAQSGEMRQMEGDILILLQDEAEAARVERPFLNAVGVVPLLNVTLPESLKRMVYKSMADDINDRFKELKVDKKAEAKVKSSCPITPWLFWRTQRKGSPYPEGYVQFPTPVLTCVEIHVSDAKAIAKTERSAFIVEFASGLNFSIDGMVNSFILHTATKAISDKGFAFYTMLSGGHIGAQPEISLIDDTMRQLQKKDDRKSQKDQKSKDREIQKEDRKSRKSP